MPVRFTVPSLRNSLLIYSPIAPASLAPAANGVRRRAMNSYQNYGRKLEIQPNVEGTILICTSRIVFLYV